MENYLLVYLLLSGAKKEEKYIAYMAKALSVVYGKVVYEECEEGEDLEAAIGRIWEKESKESYGGLICVTSRLLGPFWNIEGELSDFEAGTESAMAYYDLNPSLPDFFVLKREACFGKFQWSRIDGKRLICGQRKKGTVREDWFCPDTLIRRGYPFFNMDCLTAPDGLKYTMMEEPARAWRRIEKEMDYDTDIIWEAVLKRYNLYDIKRALHLNWIIQGKQNNYVCDKKVAVFLHLFYKESLDDVMGYIKEIPSGVDIYISTAPSQVDEFLEKLKENQISITQIIEAGNRGRDAGALLVAFRPYLMQYEYICFLHDKRTSGGLGPETVGKSFMGMIWDSLLKDSEHICEILECFDMNKRLGVLAPPIPVMEMYIKTILGAEWTVCFEKTRQLAHKLGCRIRIHPDKPVFALSTSFWCRTKALEPLFAYPWKYGDFPEEPLRLDGTINHAIERILIYVAQERGYYSVTATAKEYASVYQENLLYIVEEIFGELHRGNWLELRFPLKLNHMLEELCRLAVFCREHRQLFIYGAGAQAEILANRLHNLQIEVSCVVVTDKHGQEQFLNYPVKEFREIREKLKDDCGIILAMSRKFQEEVIDEIEKTGVDYYRIEAEE